MACSAWSGGSWELCEIGYQTAAPKNSILPPHQAGKNFVCPMCGGSAKLLR